MQLSWVYRNLSYILEYLFIIDEIDTIYYFRTGKYFKGFRYQKRYQEELERDANKTEAVMMKEKKTECRYLLLIYSLESPLSNFNRGDLTRDIQGWLLFKILDAYLILQESTSILYILLKNYKQISDKQWETYELTFDQRRYKPIVFQKNLKDVIDILRDERYRVIDEFKYELIEEQINQKQKSFKKWKDYIGDREIKLYTSSVIIAQKIEKYQDKNTQTTETFENGEIDVTQPNDEFKKQLDEIKEEVDRLKYQNNLQNSGIKTEEDSIKEAQIQEEERKSLQRIQQWNIVEEKEKIRINQQNEIDNLKLILDKEQDHNKVLSMNFMSELEEKEKQIQELTQLYQIEKNHSLDCIKQLNQRLSKYEMVFSELKWIINKQQDDGTICEL